MNAARLELDRSVGFAIDAYVFAPANALSGVKTAVTMRVPTGRKVTSGFGQIATPLTTGTAGDCARMLLAASTVSTYSVKTTVPVGVTNGWVLFVTTAARCTGLPKFVV